MFSDSFQHAPARTTLEIGQVLGGAFSAMRRNWLTFLVVGLVFEVMPAAAYAFLSGRPVTATDVSQLTPAFGAYLLFVIGQGLILQSLFAAMIAWTIWADEAGTRPTLAETVRAAIPHSPWIVLTYIVFTVIAGLGAVLLVVPGVMAATAFYVTIPVCVTEKLGPRASLSRSLQLTRGQRWRILGLYVVILVIAWGFNVVANLAGLMAGFSFAATGSPLVSGLRILLAGLASVFGAACCGSAYVELRTVKEGVGARHLAEVFA